MEETPDKTSSLKARGAWLLAAKITGFALATVLPLFVVRILTQEQVGVYRQAFLVVTNAVSILPLGFSMSAFYYLSRARADRPAAIINVLLFNFVTGGAAFLLLFFYPQLLGNLFQNTEMTLLAPKIGVVVWLWIFGAFLEIAAIANQESRLSTAFIILAQLTKTALMSGAIFVFGTVEAFIDAAIWQGVLQTLVLLVYLNYRFPRFWTAFRFGFFREQLFYALPFGLSGLLWTLQNDIHNYFVGYRFGEAEFAVYAYGCFQLPLFIILGESVASVLIPRMSQLQAEDKKREIIELAVRATQKLAFFFFPAYVFLFLTAQTFIITLFTQKFEASVPIFLINLTLLPFDALILDAVMRAYKQVGRQILVLRVFIFAALVGALYFGIRNFDLRGMIAIVVAATLVDRLAASILIARQVNFKLSDLSMFKGVTRIAAASLVAGAAMLPVYLYSRDLIAALALRFSDFVSGMLKPSAVEFFAGVAILGVSFVVFAAVYLLAAHFLNVIDEEDKAMVGDRWAAARRFFAKKSNSSAVLQSPNADYRPLTTDH